MLFNHIFLYYYIIKTSHRLTLYHLKDKNEVGRLTSPYRLKNYGVQSLRLFQSHTSPSDLLLSGAHASQPWPLPSPCFKGLPNDFSSHSLFFGLDQLQGDVLLWWLFT
jgi:hypothetical protein